MFRINLTVYQKLNICHPNVYVGNFMLNQKPNYHEQIIQGSYCRMGSKKIRRRMLRYDSSIYNYLLPVGVLRQDVICLKRSLLVKFKKSLSGWKGFFLFITNQYLCITITTTRCSVYLNRITIFIKFIIVCGA